MECFGGDNALRKLGFCPGFEKGLHGVRVALGGGIAERTVIHDVSNVHVAGTEQEELADVNVADAEDNLVQIGQPGRFHYAIQRHQADELPL